MADYVSTCGGATSTICSSSAASSVGGPQLKCPMCRQLYIKPVLLSCGHSFCKLCVDKWLRNCTTCSVCRVPTLNPVRNCELEKLVAEEQKRRDANRHLLSRTIGEQFRQTFLNGRTVRKVRALQKESTRASMRRPMNFKFDLQPFAATSQQNKENQFGNDSQNRSVLQRSIRRMKRIF